MQTLRHQCLLAMPSLEEGYFSGTVCFLCEHNDEGAFGLIVNRPTEHRLGTILEQLGIEGRQHAEAPVLEGGPVQNDRGFLLHTADRSYDSTVDVDEDLRLSTGREALAAIAAGGAPRRFLLALGYAGWGPGQLEQEMAANAWLNCPATHQLLFEVPFPDRPRAAAAALGVDFRLLGSQPGRA